MTEEIESPPTPAPFWTVAIYLVDRAYGGPEEGGWYYNCGDRVDHALDGIEPEYLLTVKPDEKSSDAWCASLQALLDETVNVGRRDIGSVLSTGKYYAEVHNGHSPKHYPETRPHYE
ncbi:hypothetical protein [Bradyrhizobium sp. Tv2a-2]|uniref:hypothetical protein n=1 Tax=Bradyrhizobium sp. Tv2a-2 TaxID=113395 RepID=UPI0004185533|nr:hypothetical protein [Bradyrhizobium sp. Tv2a-2]